MAPTFLVRGWLGRWLSGLLYTPGFVSHVSIVTVTFIGSPTSSRASRNGDLARIFDLDPDLGEVIAGVAIADFEGHRSPGIVCWTENLSKTTDWVNSGGEPRPGVRLANVALTLA